MTEAKEALDCFEGYLQSGPEVEWPDCLDIIINHKDAIRRALRVLDKIESGQLHKPTVGEECQLIRALSYNQCLDDLRGIE